MPACQAWHSTTTSSAAHLSHAVIAEASEALDKDPDGHALNRVEVDRGSTGHWIVVWL